MISDNDLLLYHYGDGLDAEERERIRIALATQPQLTERLRAIVAELDRMRTPEVTVPADVEQRWQRALELANSERPRSRATPRFQWAAAATACIALLAIVIVNMRETSAPSTPTAQTVPPSTAPRNEHGLQWHLASTEQQLAAIGEASDADRARLVQTVLEQNRLFAAAAERAGDERLARALRAFAPILQNLAEPQAADAAPGDLAQLSFELRVMQARLAADSPAASDPRAVTL